jgi:hypothetical protein
MGVENKTAVLAKLGDYRWADSDIRDEVAIHHIEVHHVYAGRLNHGYLVGQPGEVGA